MKLTARRPTPLFSAVLFGTIAAALACEPPAAPPESEASAEEGEADSGLGLLVCPQAPPPVAPGPADLYPDGDEHWIAIDPTRLCDPILAPPPSPPGTVLWRGRHLLSGAAHSQSSVSINGQIAAYCVYTWAHGGGPPDPSLLPVKRARDRRALSAQGTLEQWAHDTFLEGIGSTMSAPEGADPRVRVIVADTEAHPGELTGSMVGTSTHGRAMADLLSELACAGASPCTVEVETHLALPLVRRKGEEVRVDNRGDHGRLSDLAVAVERALARWRDDLAGPPPSAFPEALILNLSLGFHAGAPAPDETMDATSAVRHVLRAFSCHGGAILAAAGNHDGAPGPEAGAGLLYPAAFQDEPAPSVLDCQDLLGTDFYDLMALLYVERTGYPLHRPYPGISAPRLLHAVGAVDHGGQPITKSREDACPRFAALGIGWSPADTSGSLFTGTSVSAAVVSGLLASSWAQDSLAGQPSPPHLGAHPETILRSMASAFTTFRASGPCRDWSCGDVPWIGGPPAAAAGDHNPADSQNPADSFPWEDYAPDSAPAEVDKSTADHCGVVPQCEWPGVSPVSRVFPQPNDVPCTRGCVVRLPGSVADYPVFFIRPAMELTYPKLIIEGPFSREVRQLGAGGAALHAGRAYRFSLPGAAGVAGARVTFSALDLSASRSVSEQVLLAQ